MVVYESLISIAKNNNGIIVITNGIFPILSQNYNFVINQRGILLMSINWSRAPGIFVCRFQVSKKVKSIISATNGRVITIKISLECPDPSHSRVEQFPLLKYAQTSFSTLKGREK